MKFVYCSKGNPHVDIMMSDLNKCNEVIVLDGTLKSVENIFLRIIRKVHMNKKINRIINLPMKRIWLNSHMPKLKKEEDYCFIFIDSVPYALDFTWLKRLRGKSNGKVRFLLFLFNPVELFKERTVYDLKNIIFDYVLTYDFSDSQKYGFIQYNAPYSIVQNEEVVDVSQYYTRFTKTQLTMELAVYAG